MSTHDAGHASAGPDARTVQPAADSELTVAELGEFGLISRLARLASYNDRDPFDSGRRDPLQPEATGNIGIGDDAALWTPRPGFREVLTTDALIENVHFRHTTTSWRDLGTKAMASNLSDIAAMGARPLYAFVTLGVRPDTRISDLEDLYGGLMSPSHFQYLMVASAPIPESLDWRVVISGGDTVSSPVTMLSITVVGELAGEGLRRAAGQPGDLLAVTGTLGGSAGGLALLEQGIVPPYAADDSRLIDKHVRPSACVSEGLALVQAGVRCGMDLSDGLLGDAGKLAYASGLSVTLLPHLIPIMPELSRRFGEDTARQMALTGGEDYQLLVAGQPETLAAAAIALQEYGLRPLAIVGRLEAGPAGQVTVEDEYGATLPHPRSSWDHFRQQDAPQRAATDPAT